MEPQEVRMTVKATTAIVTCEEHVYTRRFVRGQKRKTELVNKLQATNIFRKIGGRWYLTYHHSSWHADSDQSLAMQNLKVRRIVDKRELLWVPCPIS
jgi:ketosteroid isomerase-like protein